MNRMLVASVVLAVAGAAMVLLAVVVLAGWPWACALAGVTCVYGAHVVATRVDEPVRVTE